MEKKLITLLLVIVFLFCGGIATAASPTDDLKPVIADLIAVLSDESLKGNEHLVERREKIMANIERGFNFRLMSMRVLGKTTWRKLNEDERDNFTRLMTKYLENIYIGKFERFSEPTVEYIAEKVEGKKAKVKTLIEDNGAKLPVLYEMYDSQSKWMVYDINIEGASLVKNYYFQFQPILQKEKYEGLVKVIEEKNKSFSQKLQK